VLVATASPEKDPLPPPHSVPYWKRAQEISEFLGARLQGCPYIPEGSP